MIISISGMSGAGKTTITKNWCKNNPEFKAFFYDDYGDDVVEPSNWIEWLDRGANYSEWDAPQLFEDLIENKSKKLIVDYPFGRVLKKFSDIIDYSFYLNISVENALVRRKNRGDSNEGIKGKVLDLFTEYHNKISPSCDVQLDSSKNIDEIVGEIKTQINIYMPNFVKR